MTLSVAEGGRHLARADGSPFFWLSDTAWLLLYRLNWDETDRYLCDRAAKGFTVVKVMVLEEFGELLAPNRDGALPLLDRDPARPNPAFFAHVDRVLARAAELGLSLALTVTWGDKTGPVLWGKGPVVFDERNARTYGRWLGARYRSAPNVIWVLGGDRPAVAEEGWYGYRGPVTDYRPLWRAMAAGLKEGGATQPMTYHPSGGSSSSRYLHAEPWLDFNLIQSGHGARNQKNYDLVAQDWSLAPAKPTLDDEINYEDHAVNWDRANGYFDDHDVRKLAYWGLFAGGCGITYGSTPVFLFQDADTEEAHARFGGRTDWRRALDLPGACQVGHARRLFESVPWQGRVPDQSLLADPPADPTLHQQACRDRTGGWAMVYAAAARPIAVNAASLTGDRLRAWWFDPRTGVARQAGEFARANRLILTPPEVSYGLDWVLVLRDAATAAAPPGGTGV